MRPPMVSEKEPLFPTGVARATICRNLAGLTAHNAATPLVSATGRFGKNVSDDPYGK